MCTLVPLYKYTIFYVEYELQFTDGEGKKGTWTTGVADIAATFLNSPTTFIPSFSFDPEIARGISEEYSGENRARFQELLEAGAAGLNGHPKTIQTAVRGLAVKIMTK